METIMMIFAYITFVIVAILLLTFLIFSVKSLNSDNSKYENIADISGFLLAVYCLTYVIICC